MSCDSDGFESGPYYSRATRGRRVKVTDSDSDLTDVGKGTPCSSRTGSGSSRIIENVSEMSPRGVCIVLDKVFVSPEQEESMDDSRLERTVIEKDADCTFTEEKDEHNATETKQEDETPLEKSTAEESSIISPDESVSALEKAPADEPAVITVDHQEELPAESLLKEASEMETMQETVQAPEPSKPLQSALVNTTTSDSQITDNRDEDMEVAIVDTDTVDEQNQEDGDVEMTRGEETEATSVSGEAQQVVKSIQESEIEEEPLQATSSQQFSEQPPQGTVTQSKTAVSFLDSSEDEDDDFADESGVSSGDEGLEDVEGNEETVQSSKTEVTKSVEGLFMIDTRPGQEADEQYYQDGQREDRAVQEEAAEEEEDEEFVDEEGESEDDDAADVLFSSRNPQAKGLSSRIDPGIRMKELGGLYISFDGSKSKPVSGSQQKTKGNKIQDEVMKKSVIGPDFAKKEAVPPYKESKHALKLKHRTERAKTTGDSWFNMKAPEITPELKGDLQLLRMRGSMDSKRFYKKNDRDGFPKYFQMGTVVDSPVDFYHSRVSKKDRKRTMVEELLTDAEFRQTNKKKFHAIVWQRRQRRQLAGGTKRKTNSTIKSKPEDLVLQGVAWNKAFGGC
uniref:Fcf2 pre-rRNA processing C-terminal domain-containing protein n=1 Tax=Neogobius melanostomus TaxID=47308 RepID=A0A8C6SJE7_9GOBI